MKSYGFGPTIPLSSSVPDLLQQLPQPDPNLVPQQWRPVVLAVCKALYVLAGGLEQACGQRKTITKKDRKL